MISNIGAMPMQGMQQMQQARPSMPDPNEMMEIGLQRLEDNLESGKVDSEELEAKLEERFGDKADGIVSEDGEVDFEALKDLLTEDRNEKIKEGLTERFGAEAAESVFSEDGSIDEDALKSLFEQAGAAAQMPPPPPPAGDSEGEGEGDFLMEVNGDAPPPPPGGPGGPGGAGGPAEASASDETSDTSSLQSMLQELLSQREETTSYGSQGEKQSSQWVDGQSLIDLLA